MRPAALAVLLLAGCSSLPSVLVESKPQRCEVPAVVTDPVHMPPRLAPGATNEDLWLRGGAGGSLEVALEKCNARLADVQDALRGMAKPESPEPGLWDRLRSLFTRKEAP